MNLKAVKYSKKFIPILALQYSNKLNLKLYIFTPPGNYCVKWEETFIDPRRFTHYKILETASQAFLRRWYF